MSRIRVLVVDDSVVIRRLVTDALTSDPDIEVVGVAANGQIALAKVETLAPDAVTMDIEMPVMNGIEAVRALRAAGQRMPIIMFSTLTERGAVATLDALSAGADDYVTKPTDTRSLTESLGRVRDQLLPRIKALVDRRRGPSRPAAPAPAGARTGAGHGPASPQGRPREVVLRPAPARRRVRAVVLGSSTGGPEALSTVLGGLAAPLPVPALVVQHMPPVFTRQLAARLDRVGPSTVVEAEDGTELRPGVVHVAPGDRHLVLERTGATARVRLDDGPPVNYCRPSVDVLFRSAVRALGGDLLGVVLTGMGADGRDGAGAVADAGGTVVVQDESSSVVWGMPGAVATAGHAHRVVPLTDIAPTVARLANDESTRPGR